MKKKIILPDFKKRGGLINVVAQHAFTQAVLMVAFTDKAGFMETLKTGNAVYFSTSRKQRWMKGETSGDIQKVVRIRIDCDGDAVIYDVVPQKGGACHTKADSCFYRSVVGNVQLLPAPKAGAKEKLQLIEAQVHADIS